MIDLTTLCTLASQKAPLYLALTSVPTFKNGGSSFWKKKKNDYISNSLKEKLFINKKKETKMPASLIIDGKVVDENDEMANLFGE